MENKRRFSRLAYDENIVIKFKENFVEATLVEISLKGITGSALEKGK